jgi:hypothetical protein
MSAKKSDATSKNSFSRKSRGPQTVTPITGGTSKTPSGHLTGARTHPELEDAVRFRAYVLYEERGQQDGRDLEDWFRAEEEILSRYQKDKSA